MTDGRPAQIARRYRRERVLVWFCRGAIALALLFLLGLVANVVANGWRALVSAEVLLEVHLDPATIGEQGENDVFSYEKLVLASLAAAYPDEVRGRSKRKGAKGLMSFGAALRLEGMVRSGEAEPGDTVETWLQASSRAELALKEFPSLPGASPGAVGLSEFQAGLLALLAEDGRTRLVPNWGFFTSGDSRDPELAGIGGAVMGSLLALLVTFVVTFPVAVCAAVYLELLAPRNRFFDLVELNINNLAAVPSIVLGLLGLAVMINVVGLPRSTPLTGGLVLSMLTLPTVIIAARASLRSVSPSLLEAALSLGATRMQGVFHHVLPVAMPGVMTGTIIGMAGALGETAPLLMIGMVAFIVAVPTGVLDVASALPVQVFLWADSPERGFVERTALAICVLIIFLLLMNAMAIWLRKRFEIQR